MLSPETLERPTETKKEKKEKKPWMENVIDFEKIRKERRPEKTETKTENAGAVVESRIEKINEETHEEFDKQFEKLAKDIYEISRQVNYLERQIPVQEKTAEPFQERFNKILKELEKMPGYRSTFKETIDDILEKNKTSEEIDQTIEKEKKNLGIFQSKEKKILDFISSNTETIDGYNRELTKLEELRNNLDKQNQNIKTLSGKYRSLMLEIWAKQTEVNLLKEFKSEVPANLSLTQLYDRLYLKRDRNSLPQNAYLGLKKNLIKQVGNEERFKENKTVISLWNKIQKYQTDLQHEPPRP